MFESAQSKKINQIGIIVGAQVLLAGGVTLLYKTASHYYNMILCRGKNGVVTLPVVMDAPEQAIRKEDAENAEAELEEWLRQTPRLDWFTRSYDGLELYAAAYTQESDKWAVAVHGYTGQGCDMNAAAKRFYQMGFNVLVPDCRGHGRSEGKYIGMGWDDRLDIVDWTRQIAEKAPQSRILLYGLSMGAATVLMASGEELPANVKCLIEDCGYTSVAEEFSYHMKSTLHLPRFPLLNLMDWFCKFKAGYRLMDASAIKQVKKASLPIMFIHGGKDRFVPTSMVYKLYEAADCPKELFVVPEAGHGVSESVSRPDYWAHVGAFIQKYF